MSCGRNRQPFVCDGQRDGHVHNDILLLQGWRRTHDGTRECGRRPRHARSVACLSWTSTSRAPGLDTFEVFRPRKEVAGIIDFVARYLNSGKVPDVGDYIGNCADIGDGGGKLWIMPSGRNGTYTATMSQIDWVDLYERRDGYLLFEDLRAQWSRALQPDYVLIDSRTGHTDSSGICTRQLPDSVIHLVLSERAESSRPYPGCPRHTS